MSDKSTRRPGTPLVYAARRTREQAARLLPRGTVIEVEVGRWIAAGHVPGARRPLFCVRSPDGCLEAVVSRRPGAIRPHPRAWLVHELRPITTMRR